MTPPTGAPIGTAGGGPGLCPTWERCEHCHAQLYIVVDATPGQPGFWRPRFAPEQRHCPAGPDPAQPGHRQDLAWALRFVGPACDGSLRIDGPDRATIACPRRPRRQIGWTIPRVGGDPRGVLRQQQAGCGQHFPELAAVADAQVAAARYRFPDWPGPSVTDLALVTTTRDTAHGRRGTWTETPAEHVQYHLF